MKQVMEGEYTKVLSMHVRIWNTEICRSHFKKESEK
jgi:hypothetical protein